MGGDWYDVIPIPGGRVGLVMGDVAGKGLAAASMVGRLRSALRAYALEGHDPATVLDQLNRLLWTEAESTQMATLLYAIVDPADASIRWVNAGHMPPLVVAEDEAPRFLGGPRAVPLGVLPFPAFEEVSSVVPPGAIRGALHGRPDRAVRGDHRRGDVVARPRGDRGWAPIRRRSATTCSRRSCPRAARRTTWPCSRSATSRWPTASRASSNRSRSRWRPCAACCAAGCATPRRTTRRRRRS